MLALAGLAAAPATPQEGAGGEPEAPAANSFGRKYPPRVYRTVRLTGSPPVVDGRLDDAAWTEGHWAGDYTQQIPTEGAPPTKPTELKILYDDRNVYFAIRAHDDPALVHRYPGRRDAFTGDIVGVCFDSYNDKRTGFEFDLTAGGSKIDLLLGNGETEWDTNWDAVWDGEVAHDEGGWTAEFRVPLSQLRYGSSEPQVWGLHAWRWIDRNQEEDQWQLIPRQNTGRMYQLGELHGLQGLRRGRHVELLPHVVGRAASGGSGSAGLDAKIGLTPSFTLDLTVNPDFGQVEADPSVLNLTAYETFYEEKRPFFLEGKKILSLDLEDSDTLFYSRRVGQAPSLAPLPGGTGGLAESTTILGAAKVTGKTPEGLSVGVLQSFTQREVARPDEAGGGPDHPIEPFGSYTVARVHKDWDKGNTALGGMVTAAARSIDDPRLAGLPSRSLTAGFDFVGYFADRSWLLEATGVASRVTGAAEALREVQTNAVHYYQRPGASHLGLDPAATALTGHGGSVRFGRSETGRLRLLDHVHWYSPGLELNDLGYLRQADLIANQVFLGWSEPSPKGPFRRYAVELSREDEWDFGGLKTWGRTGLEAEAQLANKWLIEGEAAVHRGTVDTRLLRGGPAMRLADALTGELRVSTDPSRRVSGSAHVVRESFREGGSGSWAYGGTLSLRPTRRLSLGAETYHRVDTFDLQYVGTPPTAAGPRWVLGRLSQDTWGLTLRVNLAISPDLTVQYYGSPFLGTGRYTAFKRAADTLAGPYRDRIHAFAAGEIAYRPEAAVYDVKEPGGSAYSFPDPDFSVRELRSNLVVRWEYRPGSSLYVVWSQGRTSPAGAWQPSLGEHWDALWSTRPDNVFLVKLSYWFSP